MEQRQISVKCKLQIMETNVPVLASVALHHEVIRVVWHLTFAIPWEKIYTHPNYQKQAQNACKEKEQSINNERIEELRTLPRGQGWRNQWPPCTQIGRRSPQARHCQAWCSSWKSGQRTSPQWCVRSAGRNGRRGIAPWRRGTAGGRPWTPQGGSTSAHAPARCRAHRPPSSPPAPHTVGCPSPTPASARSHPLRIPGTDITAASDTSHGEDRYNRIGGAGNYHGRACWCRGWCTNPRPSFPASSSPWPWSEDGFGGVETLARGETETLARWEKGSGAEAEKEWLLLGAERGEGGKQFRGDQRLQH